MADKAFTCLALIFSKDRALQLHALLTSWFHHVKQETSQLHTRVMVLYLATSDQHEKSYQQLKKEFPQVYWQPELQFVDQLHQVVSNPFWTHLLFLVDDSIVVRGFSLEAACQVLQQQNKVISVNLRVGDNTTYCYTLGKDQSLQGKARQKPFFIHWNWTLSDGDFGYPLELSSSLYRTSDIYRVVSQIEYKNPNTLEEAMNQWIRKDLSKVPHQSSELAHRFRSVSFPLSVCFSLPLNITQTQWDSKHANRADWNTERLCQAYLDGKRMSVSQWYGYKPRAAHEIPHDFKPFN